MPGSSSPPPSTPSTSFDPAAGSPAALDGDAEASLTEPMWETPVIHVDGLGSMALHSALVHARMFATALAHMDPPPI